MTQQSKARLYENMAAALGSYWEIDAAWCEKNDPRWLRAREIDEALVAQREDPGISNADYRKLTVEMVTLYVTAK